MDLIELLGEHARVPACRDSSLAALRHLAAHSSKPEIRERAQGVLEAVASPWQSQGGIGDRVLIEVQRPTGATASNEA